MIKLFLVEYNRPDVWERCASSWKNMAAKPDEVKVYYVDNGSPDPEIESKLKALKMYGHIDEYHVNKDNVGPAKARNHYWIPELENSKDIDLFGKIDGNHEALKDWDKTVIDYFESHKDVGALCFGAPDDISLNKCLHRAYPVIFAKARFVKKIGGFRCYYKETGTPWGCDDIDFARISLFTKYRSEDIQIAKKYERPKELCALNKKDDMATTKRIIALGNNFNKYRTGKNIYIGGE